MVNDFLKIVIYLCFMENISELTECDVLFNNEHLILIWFLLFIDTEFDLKITLRILNTENHQVY